LLSSCRDCRSATRLLSAPRAGSALRCGLPTS